MNNTGPLYMKLCLIANASSNTGSIYNTVLDRQLKQ